PLYWSYWHVEEGAWVYNVLGASQTVVYPGQVYGWVWGDGSTPPPLTSFSDVCTAEEPTATSTRTSIPTETPTLSPTDTLMPTLTATMVETNTPIPSYTPINTNAVYPPPAESLTSVPSEQPSTTPVPSTPTQSISPLETIMIDILPLASTTPTSAPSPSMTPDKNLPLSLQEKSLPPSTSENNDLNKLLIFGLSFVFAGLGLLIYQASPKVQERFLRYGIYGLTTGVGMLSFLYPFFSKSLIQSSSDSQGRGGETFFLLLVILGISFLVLLFEVQGQAVSTKAVAMLGVLGAINATLRFTEVAFPGPAGFSPIFFLIVLTGYVYGGSMGFLLGVLTMLVSAIVTGGVGPWLPGQMFAAGWVGLSTPLLRPLIRKYKHVIPHLEILALASFAAVWGVLFGMVMNLWFWPFFSGPNEQYWQPGIRMWDTISRYLTFYLATSLVWDIFRAIGNFLLILFFGKMVLRVLRRFRKRLTVHYQPIIEEPLDNARNV
ncbi:MAG: ECF transporter S component, partial [Anaerolineales bacterium]|nr:ECF transporter S component [Anaerolineales bacterium]